MVETKNGAVIRKHLGYGLIDAAHAERLQQFYSAHFNPYLNYHRPCAQAEIEIDEKGRQQRVYRRYQTPLETLLALPQPQQYLRPGLTLAVLQRIAATRSDTEAAQRMQQAKRNLFEKLRLPAGGPWKMTEEKNPPNTKSGDFSLPWKAQKTKARFPHSHRPGYGC